MKFLVDQDVYKMTIDKMNEWGYDIVTAGKLGMQRASDEELLDKAKEMKRIMITRDKDFGALLFLRRKKNEGVILLRGSVKKIDEIHGELKELLLKHTETELRSSFCVVEPNRYRIRRLTA